MSDKPQAPRTYGGRFTQTTEDKSCCVAGVWCDVRRVRFQCKHKRGKGPGGLYCGIHNPEARAEKQRKRDAVLEAKRKFQLDNSPLTIALRRAERAEAEVERLKGVLYEALNNAQDRLDNDCRCKDCTDTLTGVEATLRSALEAKP